MTFDTATVTSSGERDNNQDYCGSFVDGGNGLWVVADGLGGHKGGQVASQLVVEEMIRLFRERRECSEAFIEKMFTSSNKVILEKQQTDESLWNMKTTVALLMIAENQALLGHIGDTRIYHLRGGKIFSVTRDHSVPQALVDAGEITPEEIPGHPDRNRLLKSLGGKESVKPTITADPIQLEQGDKFLICTDGWWELADSSLIQDTCRDAGSAGEWLNLIESHIKAALKPGDDNYSAIAVLI